MKATTHNKSAETYREIIDIYKERLERYENTTRELAQELGGVLGIIKLSVTIYADKPIRKRAIEQLIIHLN